MYNDDNKFNLYLAQIEDGFNKKPKKTKDIIDKYLEIVDYKQQRKNRMIIIDKYKYILLIIIISVLILCLGIFYSNEADLYIAGYVFFIVGMLIGVFIPRFGFLFFLSHGLVGLGLMLNSFTISDYLLLLTDATIIHKTIIFILIGVLFLLAIFTEYLNSFGKLKNKKYGTSYPFIFMFLFLLSIILIPQMYKFLNWLI